MFTYFAGDQDVLEDEVGAYLPKASIAFAREQSPLRLGTGACKSCECLGYKIGKPNYYGNCNHHFNQHA